MRHILATGMINDKEPREVKAGGRGRRCIGRFLDKNGRACTRSEIRARVGIQAERDEGKPVFANRRRRGQAAAINASLKSR
jgi:hypothetical protein